MTVTVDYKIKQDIKAYPIHCDSSCLNTEPLKNLCVSIQEYINVVDRANVLIKYADGSRLFEIMRAIAEELAYGRDELDAVIMVSHKYKLPLNMVFLAYSLRENYHAAYEQYIWANVVKILHELGLKPMQIYRKIYERSCINYRGILEIIKAWNDDDYIALKFVKNSE